MKRGTNRDDGEVSDVTLVVTSYNHQSYLEQCLDSIAAQTRPARQVIIIDDFSSDDSANLIERWLSATSSPYEFIRHTVNRGVCASLNEALELAEGRFFCHASGDDWQMPDRLAVQSDALDASNVNTALVVSNFCEVDAGGGTIVDHDFGPLVGWLATSAGQPRLLESLLDENVIRAPAVMMRTERVRDVGGYDEALAFEDYDLWLRLAGRYAFTYQPNVVSNYRIVTSGLTRNVNRRSEMLHSEAVALAKHIGSSSEHNRIITRRLLHLAGQLLEIGSGVRLRQVLGMAAASSDANWIRRSALRTRFPGGMRHLRASRPAELGLENTSQESH